MFSTPRLVMAHRLPNLLSKLLVLSRPAGLTRTTLVSVTAGLLFAATALGQINVGISGTGPITFDTLPPVAEWATRQTIGGSSSDIANAATMDLRVQTNTAAMFDIPLATSSNNPPFGTVRAVWSSSGQYILTRPAEPGYLSDSFDIPKCERTTSLPIDAFVRLACSLFCSQRRGAWATSLLQLKWSTKYLDKHPEFNGDRTSVINRPLWISVRVAGPGKLDVYPLGR